MNTCCRMFNFAEVKIDNDRHKAQPMAVALMPLLVNLLLLLAPLFFARDTIIVAINFSSRTIAQIEFCLIT